MAVLLQVRTGPATGAMHPVIERATIGRGTSADVVIPDIAVSRLHASVRVDGQTCVVEDLDSSNGTLVNGEEISGARRLAAGDVVTVGSTELEVRVEPDGDLMANPTTPTEIWPPSSRS
jgi:pSer/pThr/pTyr-binding forkhead associated (FHA) protein